MEQAIKTFFDNNLLPGMCYPGSGGQPLIASQYTKQLALSDNAKLIYQDGTACSASHAFIDIYRNLDETYTVITDSGSADHMGNSYDSNYNKVD